MNQKLLLLWENICNVFTSLNKLTVIKHCCLAGAVLLGDYLKPQGVLKHTRLKAINKPPKTGNKNNPNIHNPGAPGCCDEMGINE